MSVPTPQAISARLNSAASLILERSRVVSLNLPPSSNTDAQIVRALQFVRDGMAKLEDQAEIEGSGMRLGGGRGRVRNREQEEQLEMLGRRFDGLIKVLEEDDIGREKAKGLRRTVRQPQIQEQESDNHSETSNSTARPTPHPSTAKPTQSTFTDPLSQPSNSNGTANPFTDDADGDDDDDDLIVHRGASGGQMQGNYRDELLSGNAMQGGRRGSYDPDDPDGAEQLGEQQILDSQRNVMDEQDARLTLLSTSINRQQHVSLQISSELEEQNELLDDTDRAMDGTAERMRRAKGRLNRVARGGKEHASTITIAGLILVLLLLIIVLKT